LATDKKTYGSSSQRAENKILSVYTKKLCQNLLAGLDGSKPEPPAAALSC